MSLTPADIRQIIDALQESDWDQASVVIGETRIAVSRNGMALEGTAAPAAPVHSAPVHSAAPVAPVAPAAASLPAAPAPAAAVHTNAGGAEGAADAPVPGAHVVAAPSVGVFWRSPQPGAPSFVEVGQRVEAGDTLGIVEVMKLMNNIAADVSGEIVAIHVPNAGAVEFGTPLVSIRVDG